MNILIKLTCLIGLVIAPILGNGSATEGKMGSAMEMMGNCDMSKCATMTKEECAKMCDDNGCSPEQKEMCMSHYDANGKFIASTTGKACCATKVTADKNVKVEIIKTEDGNANATVTTSENGTVDTQVFEGSLEEVKAKVEALK